MVLHPSTDGSCELQLFSVLNVKCQIPKRHFWGGFLQQECPCRSGREEGNEWFFQTSRVWREACAQGAGDVFGCVPRIFRLELALGQLSAGVAHGTKRGF